MSPLAAKIRREFGVAPVKKLIVAVSGGADSVALLHLHIEAGYKNLVVAHFNHQLRGRSSAADASFVRKMADHLKLPCEVGSDDVRKLALDRKCSLETGAREARYEFLASVVLSWLTMPTIRSRPVSSISYAVRASPDSRE